MNPLPPGTVHNRIRVLRFQHQELTQQQLADAVGVTRQTINAIEGGKYAPSLELAFRIALALETPLQEVFRYETEVLLAGFAPDRTSTGPQKKD
ncbi:MAG: helix-turn-helix transcriptional regulator [Gemmataceae bacterium]